MSSSDYSEELKFIKQIDDSSGSHSQQDGYLEIDEEIQVIRAIFSRDDRTESPSQEYSEKRSEEKLATDEQVPDDGVDQILRLLERCENLGISHRYDAMAECAEAVFESAPEDAKENDVSLKMYAKVFSLYAYSRQGRLRSALECIRWIGDNISKESPQFLERHADQFSSSVDQYIAHYYERKLRAFCRYMDGEGEEQVGRDFECVDESGEISAVSTILDEYGSNIGAYPNVKRFVRAIKSRIKHRSDENINSIEKASLIFRDEFEFSIQADVKHSTQAIAILSVMLLSLCTAFYNNVVMLSVSVVFGISGIAGMVRDRKLEMQMLEMIRSDRYSLSLKESFKKGLALPIIESGNLEIDEKYNKEYYEFLAKRTHIPEGRSSRFEDMWNHYVDGLFNNLSDYEKPAGFPLFLILNEDFRGWSDDVNQDDSTLSTYSAVD